MTKIRKYADLALSALFIISTVLGYCRDISHMSEYCFVSGVLTGIVFFVSFLRLHIKSEPLPACVYLACVADIFVIFIATMAIGLNLEGAFWFIHIINPLVIAGYWFIFCDQRKMDWKGTFSVVVFPLMYMLFAFLLYKLSGSCPFPASMIFMDYKGFVPVVILLVLAIVLWGMGALLHVINKLLRKTAG